MNRQDRYLWAYAPGAFENLKAVGYDFCETRVGEHARTFLGTNTEQGGWKGALVCDDYAAYKSLFTMGIVEAWVHGSCPAQAV